MPFVGTFHLILMMLTLAGCASRSWRYVLMSRLTFSYERSQKFYLSSSSSSNIDIGVTNNNNILAYSNGKYNSVLIDVEKVSVDDTSQFATKLWSTINHVRKQGARAIYLNVNMLFSHYIPIAGMYGFKYHHAEGEDAQLLLWIGEGESKVPPYATHHIGVGGCVISDDNKVLVVQERKNSDIVGWKLPGGLVNLGEEFSDAVKREVYEETGVATVFESILTFRHSHNVQFGRSDVYIICKLKPAAKTSDLAKVMIDNEIADAKWIDFDEYQSTNKHPLISDILTKVRNIKNTRNESKNTSEFFEGTMNSVIPGRKPFKIYK